jgi:hypothetical protein
LRNVIIDRHPLHLQCRLHHVLLLLHHVMAAVRQVLFLPWAVMDLIGVGQRPNAGGLRRIGVQAHVVHREAGEMLDARFQPVRQTGAIWRRRRRVIACALKRDTRELMHWSIVLVGDKGAVNLTGARQRRPEPCLLGLDVQCQYWSRDCFMGLHSHSHAPRQFITKLQR